MTRLESCEFCGVAHSKGRDLCEIAKQAEAYGASVAWANDPDEFHHQINFTPDLLKSWNTRATPTPSVDAAKEMLATAHDLRNNANGDCGAIQQAIYWEQKARALLDADAVEVVARALYECERKRSEYTDAVISAAAGKKVSVGMEPWEECWQVFHGDARAAIAALAPKSQPSDEILSLRARIEELERALEDIALEAGRENGGWVHLKRVIGLKARAAIGKAKP